MAKAREMKSWLRDERNEVRALAQNTGIENQYAEFVSTNENFFNNLE